MAVVPALRIGFRGQTHVMTSRLTVALLTEGDQPLIFFVRNTIKGGDLFGGVSNSFPIIVYAACVVNIYKKLMSYVLASLERWRETLIIVVYSAR